MPRTARHGLPAYLSYDRAASVLAARYLFRGMPCTIVDFGTTLSVDFLLTSFRHVYLEIPLQSQNVDSVAFAIAPQPVFNKNFELLLSDIRTRLENNYKVYIYGEKESQLERLRSIMLQDEHAMLPEFVKGKNIHAGFIDNEDRICCYSDHEIFDRFHRVRIRRTVEKSEQLTLNDLSSFNLGDYIVHIDHGVGVFGGLVKMTDDKGRVHEVVKLMYRDNDVVFVSVHALHKISRFRSKEGEAPRINKLGSKTWATMKSSAKSRVKDIAKELIQLYARRRASKGYAFSADNYLQEELESSFMYEDTPDQERATKAVKEDMEDTCPMDRLVCGDVGFGKTEIAIRAAFKAVCDSKQVAVLVPTTILALQHFETFKARLKGLPCTVDYVSRLRTAKEVTDIKHRLKEGKIDILIGTHKILGAGFEFKDLGGAEDLMVDGIESALVDLELVQGEPGDFHIDATVSQHLRKITHPLEEGIGNTRRAAAAKGNFERCVIVDFDTQDRRAADDSRRWCTGG